MQKDKHIDPEAKSRWGFGVTDGAVTVGPESVGETGGVESVRTEPDEQAARKNGGGTSKKSTKA